MNEIKLNFINNSNDMNNSNIVIFQKNNAPVLNAYVVAWKVIQNCSPMENHPFVLPFDFSVAAGDSYGNYTPQMPALAGQAFSMERSSSGNDLQVSSEPATDPALVEVRNNLKMGAISANCYKDGKLVGIETNLAPGQKMMFQFKPTIYIGVVSQIEQGEIMDSAIISEINTELNLLGISSANIVMTGGGPGTESTAFTFNLENIIYS